jgi:hypothetical protein
LAKIKKQIPIFFASIPNKYLECLPRMLERLIVNRG